MKTLGVVGLGLIGGSFVKAYGRSEDWRILGYDRDSRISQIAILAEEMDGELTADNIGEVDLLLIALYPKATVDYLKEMGKFISRGTVVIDCCGVKRAVCKPCAKIAKEYGFTYIGGHPMAGRHTSGYKFSREDLFDGQPMVIVPDRYDDMGELAMIKEMLSPAGFGSISVTTDEKHDEIIAFTSQLAHVVSNAYMKSPSAVKHKGFSAGSYRDLTRVARLNDEMWSELFLDNKDNLVGELDHLIESLREYRDMIEAGDGETLKKALAEGSRRKVEIDGPGEN